MSPDRRVETGGTADQGGDWSVVGTLRAGRDEVLDFAAWHLELGARRLHLHLDDPDDPVLEILRAHPRIRAVRCDARWWARRSRHGRPARHQVRQVLNATHCYREKARTTWLAHLDVDEFLLPGDGPVDRALAALPAACMVARIRPFEVLAPPGDTPRGTGTPVRLKGFALDRARRDRETEAIHPEFGRHLNGGMLSHAAGKLLVRTGLPEAELRIHNVFSAAGQNPGQVELAEIALAHFHARSWADWLARYRFRLARGAYRAEMRPARPQAPGARNLHAVLSRLEAEEGEAGLRRFHDEVCADTPDLRDRLRARGLLREVTMDLPRLRARHFPGL